MPAINGGMEFRHGRPIRLPPPPETLPARMMRLRCPERPEVIAGQIVRQCQVLLEPTRPEHAFHVSPVTGTVRQVTQLNSAISGGYQITLEPSLQEVETSLPIAPPAQRKLELWISHLRQTGPWSDPDGGVGLLEQLHAARQRPPDTVICIGLDAFPPYPDRSSLLMSFPEEVVQGTMLLADLVGAGNVLMLASRSGSILARLKAHCRDFKIQLRAIHNIYPSADPTLVAWMQAGNRRKLPHGVNPVSAGVLMLTPWTAIRIARWVARGRLDILRPMMVAWPEAGTPLTLSYALAGQPLASLNSKLASVLGDPTGHVVLGNPMTGRKIPSFEPLEPTPPPDSAAAGSTPSKPHLAAVPGDELLVCVLPRLAAQTPEPCISCGWCAEVCPTSLRPYHLMQLAQRGRHDHTLLEQLDWCIDCGLCSHVCPVALPLAQSLRAAAEGLKT